MVPSKSSVTLLRFQHYTTKAVVDARRWCSLVGATQAGLTEQNPHRRHGG